MDNGQQGPSGFLPVQHSARSRPHARVGLLDRSAGSKTDPIEMTVIDRALCAVDLTRYEDQQKMAESLNRRKSIFLSHTSACE